MYTIEHTSYGLRITQSGSFSIEEVELYKTDVLATLSKFDRPFSLLIDSRKLVLPTPDVLEVFSQLHHLVWQMSCERAAVVVASPVAKGMAVQACSKSRVNASDRIIDSRYYQDWEARAITWVKDGVEPDYEITSERTSH